MADSSGNPEMDKKRSLRATKAALAADDDAVYGSDDAEAEQQEQAAVHRIADSEQCSWYPVQMQCTGIGQKRQHIIHADACTWPASSGKRQRFVE